MAALILPSKRVVQPQGAVEIDWGNPITLGLADWLLPTASGFLVNGVPSTAIRSRDLTSAGYGAYTGADDGQTGSWSTKNYSAISLSNTVISVVLPTSNSVGGEVLQLRSSTGNIAASLSVSTDLTVYFSGIGWAPIGGLPIAVDTPSVLVGLVKKNVSQGLYVNGVLAGEQFDTAGGLSCDIGARLLSGYAGAVPWINGRVLLQLVFTRLLSAAEIRYISDNPWKIFKPQAARLWSVAAGGGTTYTLSPGGSFVVSGTTDQLKTKTLLPIGTVEFSGTTISYKTKTFAPSGSVVFSGSAPFSQSNTFTFSAGGSIVFSGSTAYQKTHLQEASGSITFAGTYAPLHEKTFAPSGAFTLSGTAVEIKIRVLSATGQVLFTGSAPLINPNAPVGQGTWRTLTGMGQ